MKGRYIAVVFVIVFSLNTRAQVNTVDTLQLPDAELQTGFGNNLDSLLTLWYVEQSVNLLELDSLYDPDADTLFVDFPDSVYIDRLTRIPTILDLSYNRIVRNFINVYTRDRREQVRIMLTLSEYYFPMFEEVFDKYGVPHELKYLAVIESALNPRAVSRVGATGMWQFMYYTGRSYDLNVNSLIDERRDPYKSTIAAARFLKDLHNIYEDWILVIAAYNCGPGNVNKAIRRSGGKNSFWDLYYYLPRETRGYVPAFIAASYVMNYYEDHNLGPVAVDFDLTTDTLIIREQLHFQQIAEVMKIPLHKIRDLNPQFKHDIIPGDKEYILRLPQQNVMSFISLQDSILAYKDSVFFNKEKMIVNPTSVSYTKPVLSPDKYTKYLYTVKPGDNLGFISMWYNVRVSDIRYWNNIRSNVIRTGQKLVIYIPNSRASKYADINNLSFAQKQRRIGKDVKVENKPAEQLTATEEFVYYKVRTGDTLWEIAKKYPGVSDMDISRLNNLNYGETIKPGQVLKIRRKI